MFWLLDTSAARWCGRRTSTTNEERCLHTRACAGQRHEVVQLPIKTSCPHTATLAPPCTPVLFPFFSLHTLPCALLNSLLFPFVYISFAFCFGLILPPCHMWAPNGPWLLISRLFDDGERAVILQHTSFVLQRSYRLRKWHLERELSAFHWSTYALGLINKGDSTLFQMSVCRPLKTANLLAFETISPCISPACIPCEAPFDCGSMDRRWLGAQSCIQPSPCNRCAIQGTLCFV